MFRVTERERIGVLFVCLGNICRSPLAEGLFVHKAHEHGQAGRFYVDSAGTGQWHVGEGVDQRMIDIAKKKGVKLISRARQITSDDFTRFRHIICMDHSVLTRVLKLGAPPDRTRLLLRKKSRSKTPAAGEDVPDPYLGGKEEFEAVYDMVDHACDVLLDELLNSKA